MKRLTHKQREVSMRKIKEILRLHASGLSQRQIATSLHLSAGAVNKYLQLAHLAHINWPLPDKCTDNQLLHQLYQSKIKATTKKSASINCTMLRQELIKKHVTLQLLWEEYCARNQQTQCYSYSQFCRLYKTWQGTQQLSMRQTHKAGDKVFIDYCGPTVPITNAATGEIRQAQIFVAVLGASNFTYADATWTQRLSDWISSHIRMLNYYGGVPHLLVPDNLKSGVTKACKYDPDMNRTYADFALHYDTAILPTRPRKPKDKAKAEVGVLIVERWILARLRHQSFFSLYALNQAIKILLVDLNNRPFKKLTGCRKSQFDLLEKNVLKPLPQQAYEYAAYKIARVNLDYHIEVQKHYYSVPFALVKNEVDVRLTATMVEIFFNSNRVAVHKRSTLPGAHTTQIEHMPIAHQKQAGWSADYFLNEAIKIGLSTRDIIQYNLTHRKHPEQSYRSNLGILRLEKTYKGRLENACRYALAQGCYRRKNILSILQKGLDQPATDLSLDAAAPDSCQLHENIRGAVYYQSHSSEKEES
ncbi:MAG: hypothetical protein A3E07_02790 [Candidatus Wildermuthbacteria bacterium RIFCSPHIGHO2_12_FULL_45_9]|nr:MAG: hypothetical protein A3E07_02790 [Candidatus Wildermuthbacteria bacterium RIFCSPHIGHO2_12_FULL_45_9]